MKRPMGTIGLLFLTVLAVVFFFPFPALIISAIVIAAGFLVVGTVFLVRKRQKALYAVATGAVILAALLNIFLYWNFTYKPIVDNYSDKEINVTGYVNDEISLKNRLTLVPIQTETVNGENRRLKITLIFTGECPLEEFDEISAVLTPSADTSPYSKSKGVFLSATQGKSFLIEKTGEKHFSVFDLPIKARIALKASLSHIMDRNGAAISKAILFGDKNGLSRKTQRDFNRTGTSFLIVVSGLHLSVAIALFSFLLKLFHSMKATSVGAVTAIWAFTAVSGFTPSVTRAAITATIYFFGTLIFKNSDGINSLGIAALILAVPNPFIVGNIGTLMSFSSVLGILLWAKPIADNLDRVLRIDRIASDKTKVIKLNYPQMMRYRKRIVLFRRAAQFFTSSISVSVSASLWIAPITILAFGKISPLVVIVTLITEPIAAVLLVLALLASLLGLIPALQIITVPIAAVIEFLSGTIINVNAFFAALPISYLKADRLYWYIWLGVTAALVIAGYIIRKKGFFTAAAITLSAVALGLGWAVTTITDPTDTEIVLRQSENKLTAFVTNDDYLSIVSLGGKATECVDVIEELHYRGDRADNIIIPDIRYNSTYLYSVKDELSVKKIYYGTGCGTQLDLPGLPDGEALPKNGVYSIRLSDKSADTLIINDGVCCQLISFNGKTALFVPRNADLKKLDKRYLEPDYSIIESVPKNIDLLRSKTIVYTGAQGKRFMNNRKILSKVCGELILLKGETYTIK